MIDKHLLGFTEKCLNDYHENLMDMKRRREYLESFLTKSPSDFSKEQTKSSSNGSNLEAGIERICDDDELNRLKHRTEPITILLSIVPPDDKRFIELRYFQKRHWHEVAEALHIAEVTAKTTWRNRITGRAARMLIGKVV